MNWFSIVLLWIEANHQYFVRAHTTTTTTTAHWMTSANSFNFHFHHFPTTKITQTDTLIVCKRWILKAHIFIKFMDHFVFGCLYKFNGFEVMLFGRPHLTSKRFDGNRSIWTNFPIFKLWIFGAKFITRESKKFALYRSIASWKSPISAKKKKFGLINHLNLNVNAEERICDKVSEIKNSKIKN